MENEQLGSLLREFRERNKLSQEDLAFDLCAVSTLAQIEAGKTMPSAELIGQLFGRLGMIAPALPAENPHDNQAQLERAAIEITVANKLAVYDYDFGVLLARYKACGSMTGSERQYYGYHHALYLKHTGEAPQAVLFELETALKVTLHAFGDDGLPARRYYTKLELSLLSELALAYAAAGDKRHAVALAEYVQDYVENRLINEYDAADSYPVLLQHLAGWQLEAGEAQKALRAAEKGIAACARFGALFPLLHLARAKGEALRLLGRAAEAEQCRADAERLARAADGAGTADARSASTAPASALPR